MDMEPLWERWAALPRDVREQVIYGLHRLRTAERSRCGITSDADLSALSERHGEACLAFDSAISILMAGMEEER